MKTRHGIIALLAALSLSVSCSNASLDVSPKDERDPAKGSLSVTVPSLSAAFMKLAERGGVSSSLSRAFGISSRAFIVASSVHLDFYRSGETQSFSSIDLASSSNTAASGGDGAIPGKVFLPVGTGYTVKVTLRNNANDPASRETVSGISAPFDITSLGSTAVSVSCLPVSPVDLLPGSGQEVDLPLFSRDSVLRTIVPGGEKWFRFTASSAAVRILARPVDGGKAVPALFVFDPAGKIIDSFTFQGTWDNPTRPGTPSAGYVETVPGSTYYLAAIDAGTALSDTGSGVFTGGDHRFVVSLSEAAPDSYESDDRPGLAKPIKPGESQLRSIFPETDLDWISFDVMPYKGYDISIHSVDGTLPSIEWRLVDSLNNDVGVVTTSDTTSGVLSLCTQWIPLKAGTFSLAISSSSGACGYEVKVAENKAPQNLAAVMDPASPCDTIAVSWSPVAHATAYRIYELTYSGSDGQGRGLAAGISSRGEMGGGSASLKLRYEGAARVKTDPFLHKGLAAGSRHEYRASAIIDGIETPLSAVTSGSTKKETSINVSVN